MALVGLQAFEGCAAAVEVFFAASSDDVGEASFGEVEAACGLRRHEVGDEIEGFALIFAVASQSVVGGNDIADEGLALVVFGGVAVVCVAAQDVVDGARGHPEAWLWRGGYDGCSGVDVEGRRCGALHVEVCGVDGIVALVVEGAVVIGGRTRRRGGGNGGTRRRSGGNGNRGRGF